MKLRFYAKGEQLVREPGVIEIVRTPPHYVGRCLAKLEDGRFCYPATEEAFECSVASDTGMRLMRLVKQDGALWPADEATAAACGVAFVELDWADGEWVPA